MVRWRRMMGTRVKVRQLRTAAMWPSLDDASDWLVYDADLFKERAVAECLAGPLPPRPSLDSSILSRWPIKELFHLTTTRWDRLHCVLVLTLESKMKKQRRASRRPGASRVLTEPDEKCARRRPLASERNGAIIQIVSSHLLIECRRPQCYMQMRRIRVRLSLRSTQLVSFP